MQSFKELIVWQKSMNMCTEVYRLCDKLPKAEQYGLESQIKRCAVSIPSNIAEGFKRGSKKEFAQFLRIASGSSAELETQLMIIERVFNLDTTIQLEALLEIQKMLTVLIRKQAT